VATLAPRLLWGARDVLGVFGCIALFVFKFVDVFLFSLRFFVLFLVIFFSLGLFFGWGYPPLGCRLMNPVGGGFGVSLTLMRGGFFFGASLESADRLVKVIVCCLVYVQSCGFPPRVCRFLLRMCCPWFIPLGGTLFFVRLLAGLCLIFPDPSRRHVGFPPISLGPFQPFAPSRGGGLGVGYFSCPV